MGGEGEGRWVGRGEGVCGEGEGQVCGEGGGAGVCGEEGRCAGQAAGRDSMWVGAAGLLLLAEILEVQGGFYHGHPEEFRTQVARAGLHCQAPPGPQCPVAGKQAVPGPVTGPTTLCTNWS